MSVAGHARNRFRVTMISPARNMPDVASPSAKKHSSPVNEVSLGFRRVRCYGTYQSLPGTMPWEESRRLREKRLLGRLCCLTFWTERVVDEQDDELRWH